MTNGAFLLIYLLTCAIAIKLLTGALKAIACLATLFCIAMATFVGESMLFALIAFGLAFAWEHMKSQKRPLPDEKIHVQ
jgi:amino acid efflux transporter